MKEFTIIHTIEITAIEQGDCVEISTETLRKLEDNFKRLLDVDDVKTLDIKVFEGDLK